MGNFKGNKHWANEDKQFVIDNYSTITVSELSKLTGRTVDSLRQFASVNKLSAKNNTPNWTREELLFVKKHYKKMKAEDIANKIGRTRQAVAAKVSVLGINRQIALPNDLTIIQKNVPIPLIGKKGQYYGLLAAMELDDSFEYPSNEYQTVTDAIASFQDRLFTTKKIDDNSRRCWRIL